MLPADRARLKQNWRYTLEPLTPLHIGAGGDPLVKNTDFIVTRNDVVVLDTARTFERIYERALETPAAAPEPAAAPLNPIAAALQKAGLLDAEDTAPEEVETNREADVLTRLAQGMTPQQALEAGWLTADDLRGEQSIVRYRLKPPSGVGAPLPEGLEPPQILPFSKTPAGQLYVPGSSLKGALRTALAEVLFRGWPQPLTVQDTQSRGRANAKAADDTVEARIFGRDPNHDWLRALHVGDSAAASTGPALSVAGTYSLRGQGLQFKAGFYAALEVLPVGATVQGTLRVDRTLFAPEVKERLGLWQQEEWLTELTKPCNTHALALFAAESTFYRDHGLPDVGRFYDELRQRIDHLPANQCLVQMSWGAGWRSKTLGPPLEAQAAFPAIRDQFRLGYHNMPFPKTRRLTLEGAGYTRPGVPLGWVLLTLDPTT